jgi:hypothetical protein
VGRTKEGTVTCENERFEVGEVLFFTEFPLFSRVKILEKRYSGEGEHRMVVFKIRFLEVFRQAQGYKEPEIGQEFEVGASLWLTGYYSGMWRFRRETSNDAPLLERMLEDRRSRT